MHAQDEEAISVDKAEAWRSSTIKIMGTGLNIGIRPGGQHL